jgi:FlaA1/EpsC-like NDP-sugar epimerase
MFYGMPAGKRQRGGSNLPDQTPHPRSLIGLRRWLLDLPRRKKRAILVVVDFIGLSLILLFGMSVRYGGIYVPDSAALAALLLAAPVLTVISLAYAGLYRFVTRYLGANGHSRIVTAVGISVLIWSLLVFMSGQLGVPRSVIVFYAVMGAAMLIISRHSIGWGLKNYGIKLPKFDLLKERSPVLIYGAGQAGIELARALERVPGCDVVGFVDNTPTLWGQYVSDFKVYRPEKLARVIERFGVKEILLAVPGDDRNARRLILKELEQHPVVVKTLPSLEDIAAGHVAVSDLRPLDVSDLLGRECVPPIEGLLARNTRGKCVLVTGAGGSVGAELARQVFRQAPSRLVLLDVSEPALYNIDIELRDIISALPPEAPRPTIVSVLGSVLDSALVRDTLRGNGVDTIYHAAAYKHVPIVEHNAAIGLSNNLFGTDIVAEAAIECGVERMVLVSTDKAVRPTNIMGASKRLAEQALQARAAKQPATVFTMVRFGNVLDSSGSVVGRFRRQIKAGGPVTVTHPEVVRYFMSIAEAAELVIQAGAMAKGGDIFVLDMGEPVKIDELARLMIRLSGRDVKDETNPDGDIAITYTGLRPGEKLYEELLIGANTTGTEHPRILRLDEPVIDTSDLAREMTVLRAAMEMRDMQTIQAVLMRTVEGYRPDADIQAAAIGASAWVAPSRTLH